jgi:O-antigen/teichoic acid export membrane protein
MIVCPSLILSLWMKTAIPFEGAQLLRVMSVGVIFISMSVAPYHMINGFGLPRLNLVLTVLHSSIFFLLLAFLLRQPACLLHFGMALASANIVFSAGMLITILKLPWRVRWVGE